MPRFFTKKLTIEQLAMKFCEAFQSKYNNCDEIKEQFEKAESVFDKAIVCVSLLEIAAPEAYKDIQKVQFDWENWTAKENEGFNGAENLTGFHILPNGLSYLGVVSGGDWELPIFFVLYFDGKKIRGYIPESWNPWNHKTKQAYGNDESADEEDIQKRYGVESQEDVPPIDESLVLADIQNRIQFPSA